MKLKNMIGMGWGAFGANVWNKKTPLNVMFSVTNHCNAHCSYCNIRERKQKELTTDQIFSLIDQLSESGCQRLGLWGGEPLLRDDIAAIINYAKEKGLFVTLDSNGFLLPQKINVLKNLDHLILALDGDKTAHELNRGSGSFEKVISAIKIASGNIPLWTITVLTKHNVHSIDFIFDQARKYDFLTTFQVLHHNDKLSSDYRHLFPSQEATRAAIEKIILRKKEGAPVASSFRYLRYLLDWPDYTKATYPDRFKNLKCWAGKLYCNVDTDGSVYPCSLLVEKMEALNFLDVGFKRAFEFCLQNSCQACLASCFTEYNYLYSLDPKTIYEWLNSFRRTRKKHDKRK